MSGEVPSAPDNSAAHSAELPGRDGDAAAGPGQLAAGSQIAGYRLMEQIGRGGMAVVYRAIDLRLDRPVALKILAPELARDESFRHRFIRECRAAAAVDHPCIIPVFDAGEAGGVLFIAMRYVSGRDVRTLLDREGSLPADRVVSIIEQVASALDAAHARGLVHRDVKPANMLLDSSASSGQLDHVYLSDFGLTKQSQLTSSLTSTGQFLGTLDYIAPEQIEGSKLVDGRADLYSLGCAAFEMLSGAPPFRRDQGVAVIWAQISAPPPRLTDLRPDLPAAIDSVLAKALAKAPGDRYQTSLEFAAALRGACELGAGSAASAAGPYRPTTQPARWAGMADDWPDRSAAAAFAAEPPTRASNLSPARRSNPDPSYPAAQAPSSQPYPPASQPYPPASQPYPPASQPYAPPRQPYRRGPSRRLPWWRSHAVLLAGCLAVVCLAAAAIAAVRSGAFRSSKVPLTSASSVLRTGGPAGSAGTAAHLPRGPSRTVRAYFAAINAHNYLRAWDLGGRDTGSSYVGYVNGFGTTVKDTVTIVSVSGSVVTARITAMQTDGAVKTYQGTYTVIKGVITQFNVQQVG